jgi:hypothetical protein
MRKKIGWALVVIFAGVAAGAAAGVREATYVIHYADGRKAEIPVIAGKNIFDWTTPPALEELKYDANLGFTQRATSVVVPAFVSGHVWMTLWKNPYPAQELKTWEVIGANEGIPALIALSRGIAK